MSDPKFLVLVSLDEPKGLPETGGYATGGMVSAPSVKVIISNMVSLYGILPGDWTSNPGALQIASTPAPTAAVPAARYIPTAMRNRLEQHKALPARAAGGQSAAAPGVRRVATE